MRHRVRGRKLGRKTEHRIALKRNLLKSLFTYRRVVTTLAKAKEYRPHAEKVITLARVRNLHRIRRVAQILGNDRTVVKTLFDEIGPEFVGRPGGYTRILKLAKPRLGDGAPRAILELVGESERRAREAEEAAEEAATKKGKKKKVVEPEE
jgi:large subunit ribosomal protein L17